MQRKRLTCEVVPPGPQGGYSKNANYAASMNDQSVRDLAFPVWWLATYKSPMPKIAETANFRFRGIWSPQTIGMGNTKSVRSRNAFTPPMIFATAKLGLHESCIFHRWSTLFGRHCKQRLMLTPTKKIASKAAFIHQPTRNHWVSTVKIRRYNISREAFATVIVAV